MVNSGGSRGWYPRRVKTTNAFKWGNIVRTPLILAWDPPFQNIWILRWITACIYFIHVQPLSLRSPHFQNDGFASVLCLL